MVVFSFPFSPVNFAMVIVVLEATSICLLSSIVMVTFPSASVIIVSPCDKFIPFVALSFFSPPDFLILTLPETLLITATL